MTSYVEALDAQHTKELKAASGWAVVDKHGIIDVKTVSPTERAAMVNWLWLNIGPVPSIMTDEQIAHAFNYRVGESALVEVTIRVK